MSYYTSEWLKTIPFTYHDCMEQVKATQYGYKNVTASISSFHPFKTQGQIQPFFQLMGCWIIMMTIY